MIAEALDISRETYLAILMDRTHNGPVLVGSPFGGMDIEEVAEKNPDAIFKVEHSLLNFVKRLIHQHAVSPAGACGHRGGFVGRSCRANGAQSGVQRRATGAGCQADQAAVQPLPQS